jgi:hypothetical protein
MSIGTAIFTALGGYAPLTALVGTRIYPVIAASQVAYPYVVYSNVYATPQNSLGGWSGGDNQRLQVDCWAKSYAAANDVADHVREAFAQTNASYRGVCIGVLDGPVEGGLDLYHVIVEFSLWTS